MRKLHPYSPSALSSPAPNDEDDDKGSSSPALLERGLDIGAGIGRVTSGLLSRLCMTTDVVEPQAAFAAQVPLQRMAGPGALGEVYVCGIEEWVPLNMEGQMGGTREGETGGKRRQYDLVWAQWCLGYLRDEALVTFLRNLSGRRDGRAGIGEGEGEGRGDREGYLKQGGWIIVKENVSTTVVEGKDGKSETVDVFDELDSSVTRSDATFRRCFHEAGLRVVRSELQKGFEKGLLPVRFYALRVEEGG